MHSCRFIATLFGACMLLLFTSKIPLAHAERTFGCENVWSGPSADNDASKCVKDYINLSSSSGYFAIPIVLIVFAVIVIVAVPIVFIFNGFCCEDYCFSFTRTTNLARSRCWLWMVINVNFFWSIFSAILIIYGSALLSNSVDKSTDYIRSDAISYFVDTKNTISDLLTNYSTVPPTKSKFDLSGFDQMETQLKDMVDGIRNNYLQYFSVIRTLSIIIGIAGIILMLSCFIIAYCRFNSVGAFTFGILYYFFTIIYSVMAIVLAIFTCVVFAFCGEITLQNRREPGVLQWYYVPWCERKFSFSKTRDDIVSSTADMAKNSCERMLERCDTQDDNNYEKPFLCGNNITSVRSCETIENALDVLYDTKAKTNFSDMLCVNNKKWEYQEVCNIPMCNETCINYAKPDLQIKTWASDVMNLVTFAINRTTALSYVLPVMDCNFIIDKFIAVYQTDKESSSASSGYGVYCSTMRIASVMLTVGFFVGSIMFVLSTYVTQHGIWMWNDEAEVEDIKEAEAMSKYAKSICSVDARNQKLSRTGSFVADPRASASGRGILAGSTRSMSFNQAPPPNYMQQ